MKKAAKNDIERIACSQKSDVPHTNFSMYFLLQLGLYYFLVSHKAVTTLQQEKDHIQEKAYPCI